MTVKFDFFGSQTSSNFSTCSHNNTVAYVVVTPGPAVASAVVTERQEQVIGDLVELKPGQE